MLYSLQMYETNVSFSVTMMKTYSEIHFRPIYPFLSMHRYIPPKILE